MTKIPARGIPRASSLYTCDREAGERMITGEEQGGLLAGLLVGALVGLGAGVVLAGRDNGGEMVDEARESLKAAREALARSQEMVLRTVGRVLGAGENPLS
ncbi:MAG: hypothetical protein AB1445_07230 [Bacillota bacterium]